MDKNIKEYISFKFHFRQLLNTVKIMPSETIFMVAAFNLRPTDALGILLFKVVADVVIFVVAASQFL